MDTGQVVRIAMSIKTNSKWLLKCDTCDFEDKLDSMSDAVITAQNHIEKWDGIKEEWSNTGHKVIIHRVEEVSHSW